VSIETDRIGCYVHLVNTRVLWAVLGATVGVATAQARFPMKYLDEIGHLGGMDKRTTVDLGIAKVFAEPGGDLRFEGHDAKGKLWRVWLTPSEGVGGTDVWTADFDRNGRQDLLIAAYFPMNGRCVDGTDIYTLMFDETGRPVPSVVRSNSFTGFGHPPVALVKANSDGRAEMVTVGCEYSDPATGFGEDRRISGIYEAKDARWRPIRNASEGPYLAAAKRQLGRAPSGFMRWFPTDPAQWPDFLAGYDDRPLTQMRSLLAGEAGCRGVNIPLVGPPVGPLKAGPPLKDDPCELLRNDRIVFSDGEQRRGWPLVVIDSPEGRDVFLSEPEKPLRNVLKMGYRFRALGNPASPSLLWVDTNGSPAP